jgi:hypothetical protein
VRREHVLIKVLGILGIVKDDNGITATSFDILALEALFMVPRYYPHLSVITSN